MPTIRNTVTINATPDEVWAVLSDMPATRQWLPGVVAARMDGDLRVCTMADGQEVHELKFHPRTGHRVMPRGRWSDRSRGGPRTGCCA